MMWQLGPLIHILPHPHSISLSLYFPPSPSPHSVSLLAAKKSVSPLLPTSAPPISQSPSLSPHQQTHPFFRHAPIFCSPISLVFSLSPISFSSFVRIIRNFFVLSFCCFFHLFFFYSFSLRPIYSI